MNFAVYYTEACVFLVERFLAQRKSEIAYPYGQQNKAGPENALEQSKLRLWPTTPSRASSSCAETHHIQRFRALFNRLDPSPVGIAMGQETGLLGMDVGCSRRLRRY
jgi:hypothetical protein